MVCRHPRPAPEAFVIIRHTMMVRFSIFLIMSRPKSVLAYAFIAHSEVFPINSRDSSSDERSWTLLERTALIAQVLSLITTAVCIIVVKISPTVTRVYANLLVLLLVRFFSKIALRKIGFGLDRLLPCRRLSADGARSSLPTASRLHLSKCTASEYSHVASCSDGTANRWH